MVVAVPCMSKDSPHATLSLIRILSDPFRFDGKIVETVGFLSLEFEGSAIYLSKEDYENHITWNAIFLRLDEPKINEYRFAEHKYVKIRGMYAAGFQSPSYSGSLRNTTLLRVISDPKKPAGLE